MDYKEKYEAIVGWLKKYADEGMNITPSDIRISVPELAESEDERILNALITHISIYEGDFKTVGVTRLEMLSWLEKQKEEEQKTAELSEEDIDKMVNARARKSGTTKSEMEFYRQGIKDALKSLRPQPHWKPSEEQIKALGIAIRCGIQLGTWEEDALKSLCNELKKLM